MLRSTCLTEWPTLAWLAIAEPNSTDLDLLHGNGVEVGSDWFGEAVWDGPFADGDFDQTDIVFGSGGRRRGSDWTFVSSASTVDRLHHHQMQDGRCLVSNSLACLASHLDAQVDPHFRGYFAFFESIIGGLDEYKKRLPTSAGDIGLTYFRNLRLRDGEFSEVAKPNTAREFSTYDDYHSFLTETMSALGANLSAPQRRFSMRPLASISTGYDSPTSAAVARHAGLKQTVSIVDARGGAADDGSEIARRLDLEPLQIRRDDWRSANGAVAPTRYIASDAKGEDVYFAPASQLLCGRVLFTGYSGSRVWNATQADFAQFRRGDQSGLSHTEARLHVGYIHIPTPFLGGINDGRIRALGRLEEMQPWSVGGDYDRPVCRRILEEAGVPRELFGYEKKAASILLFDRGSFLPADQSESFQQWLGEQRVGRRSRVEQLSSATRDWLRVSGGRLLGGIQSVVQRLPEAVQVGPLHRVAISGRITELARIEPQFDFLFPWALAETQTAYPQPSVAG